MSIVVISDRDARALRAAMTRLARKMDALTTQGEGTTMALSDLKTTVARIGTGLDNIAADIRSLKDQINPGGLTAAEVASLQSDLETLAARTESVAAETPDVPPTV